LIVPIVRPDCTAGSSTGRSYTRPQSDVPDRRGPKALGVTVRTIVKGKNAEIPDRVRDYAERKLKRIERLTDDRTDATVELWSEHRRSVADSHFAEVALSIDGHLLRSRATGSSYQQALDDVVDKIERQAVGYKEKPRLRSRPDEEKEILRRLADGSEGPPRERQIVKVKRFAIEPMFEEDAVARMEELGHRFFVFVSAETERVAILYQRDDGDLGMIEPVVGGDYTKPHEQFVNVAVTDDGGRTWRQPKGALPAGYMSGVAIVPGTNGRSLVAVGLGGTAQSVDGGESGKMIDTVAYNSVAFAARNDGWAAGPKGRIVKWAPSTSGPAKP